MILYTSINVYPSYNFVESHIKQNPVHRKESTLVRLCRRQI